MRCNLRDALDIIREASGKQHVFVALDEFFRIGDHSVPNEKDLLHFMATVTPVLDDRGTRRTNFVCSSLASVPLDNLEVFSGRKYMAGFALFFY